MVGSIIEESFLMEKTMQLTAPRPSLVEIVLKTVVVQTVTYFILGLLASSIFSYAALYAETSLKLFMRQTSDPWVRAGVLFQPLRGILFGVVFYLLRDVIFKKNGWLVLWLVLLIVGILSTFGPTPGSIEGMIYTILPMRIHLLGLPEVVLQSLLLSVLSVFWIKHPEKKWLNWIMGVLFFLVLLLPMLGLIFGQPK
jgi:hypothetical protein